jgi:glycosyltransferase involved in cell wall biosynthesis
MWARKKHSAEQSAVSRGNDARDTKQWADAVVAYAEHVSKHPTDFDIWVQLGHARKECGDLVGASDAYESADQLKPSNPDLLLNLGRLRHLQNRDEDALAYLRRSYEIDSNERAALEIRSLTGQERLHVESNDGFDADMKKVLTSGFFDPQWYIEAYPDVPPWHMTPLEHYMRHGAYEGRSPGPFFDGEWYLAQNPDLALGASSRTLNPLLHYIDHGATGGRKPAPPKDVLQTARILLDSIIDLDPQIYGSDHFVNVKTLQISDSIVRSKPHKAFKRVFNSLKRPYDYVICIPWLQHGGADLVAMHLARAIVELAGKHAVLVLACDYARADALDWLPPGADFEFLQERDESLNPAERTEALFQLIQAIRPKKVFNVNSEACWNLMRTSGAALSHITKLYGCAFCRDFTWDDRPAGYSDSHLRDALPNLSGVILDNASFADFLFTHFGFPAHLKSRFIVLRQPAPLPTSPSKPVKARKDLFDEGTNAPFKVFWASRFARQKNVDLLVKIVKAAPELSFEVWGRGDAKLERLLSECAAGAPNLKLMGPFEKFTVLPVNTYDAFLYTSLWDGIPNVLLEAAGADVPIVASHVGGIAELVTDTTGWLIEDFENPTAYVRALRSIRSDNADSQKRRAQMQKLLKANHSWSSYIERLSEAKLIGDKAP